MLLKTRIREEEKKSLTINIVHKILFFFQSISYNIIVLDFMIEQTDYWKSRTHDYCLLYLNNAKNIKSLLVVNCNGCKRPN